MSTAQGVKAAFLDRDGVINVDHGYVHRPEDFTFIDGVFEGCRHLQSLGYRLIVVTNQSGIARGYFTEADFHALCDWMRARFEAHGVTLDGIYFCPHHPDHSPDDDQCDCRKPAPGMLLQAIREHGIDPGRSLMVGDKGADMQAAIGAGVGRRVLVRSGQTFSDAEAALADEIWDGLGDALSRVQDGG